MLKKAGLLLIAIALFLGSWFFISLAHGQTAPTGNTLDPFKVNSTSTITPRNASNTFQIPSLPNLNCIGTNASGTFGSGTCSGGGGTITINKVTTSTFDIVAGTNITSVTTSTDATGKETITINATTQSNGGNITINGMASTTFSILPGAGISMTNASTGITINNVGVLSVASSATITASAATGTAISFSFNNGAGYSSSTLTASGTVIQVVNTAGNNYTLGVCQFLSCFTNNAGFVTQSGIVFPFTTSSALTTNQILYATGANTFASTSSQPIYTVNASGTIIQIGSVSATGTISIGVSQNLSRYTNDAGFLTSSPITTSSDGVANQYVYFTSHNQIAPTSSIPFIGGAASGTIVQFNTTAGGNFTIGICQFLTCYTNNANFITSSSVALLTPITTSSDGVIGQPLVWTAHNQVAPTSSQLVSGATSPVTISAQGLIACATCITSFANISSTNIDATGRVTAGTSTFTGLTTVQNLSAGNVSSTRVTVSTGIDGGYGHFVGLTNNGNTVSTSTGSNPTASIGTSAVNGSANTFMRSDAAPTIDQTAAFAFSALGNTTSTGNISAASMKINGDKVSTSTGGGASGVASSGSPLSGQFSVWTGANSITGATNTVQIANGTVSSSAIQAASGTISGFTDPDITSALGLFGSGHLLAAYGGASACGGSQAVTTIAAAGTTSCAAFSQISTSTANTWGVLQTFNGLIQLPINTMPSSTGQIGIETTTSSMLLYHDGTALNAISPIYKCFDWTIFNASTSADGQDYITTVYQTSTLVALFPLSITSGTMQYNLEWNTNSAATTASSPHAFTATSTVNNTTSTPGGVAPTGSSTIPAGAAIFFSASGASVSSTQFGLTGWCKVQP